MNSIKISALDQMGLIFDDLLYFSTGPSKEIFHNMWCITLEGDLIENINIEQLKYFVTRLIENRELQVSNIHFHKDIIFYMWFDKQALQLRFNVIVGDVKSLPFGCKVRLVNVIDSILYVFINTLKDVIQYGDRVQFFNKNEVDDWDEDENEEEYILDVFVRKLTTEGVKN